MLCKHQTKKLCTLKDPNCRAITNVGFILNRYDRRRLNKLVDVFGKKLICVKNKLYNVEFYLKKCVRISWFAYDREYEVVFDSTNKRYWSFIVKKDIWDNLLKYRNDCIDFEIVDYDLLYVTTSDIGNMTLNGI